MNLTKELVLEFLLIFLGVSSIIIFRENNLLIFIALLAVSIVCIRIWNKKDDLVFFLFAAIIGSIAEIFCAKYKVWGYSNPSFLGIPIWLPLVWGISFLMIKRVCETIKKFNFSRE